MTNKFSNPKYYEARKLMKGQVSHHVFDGSASSDAWPSPPASPNTWSGSYSPSA